MTPEDKTATLDVVICELRSAGLTEAQIKTLQLAITNDGHIEAFFPYGAVFSRGGWSIPLDKYVEPILEQLVKNLARPHRCKHLSIPVGGVVVTFDVPAGSVLLPDLTVLLPGGSVSNLKNTSEAQGGVKNIYVCLLFKDGSMCNRMVPNNERYDDEIHMTTGGEKSTVFKRTTRMYGGAIIFEEVV